MSGEGGERILLLWERYGGALFRYVRRMLGSGSPAMDAEDIVSEAFLRVMERYERYGERTDEQMKALLLRVCRNLSLDERRRSAVWERESWLALCGIVDRVWNGTVTPEEGAGEFLEKFGARLYE